APPPASAPRGGPYPTPGRARWSLRPPGRGPNPGLLPSVGPLPHAGPCSLVASLPRPGPQPRPPPERGAPTPRRAVLAGRLTRPVVGLAEDEHRLLHRPAGAGQAALVDGQLRSPRVDPLAQADHAQVGALVGDAFGAGAPSARAAGDREPARPPSGVDDAGPPAVGRSEARATRSRPARAPRSARPRGCRPGARSPRARHRNRRSRRARAHPPASTTSPDGRGHARRRAARRGRAARRSSPLPRRAGPPPRPPR